MWGSRLPQTIHRHHIFARQEFLNLGIKIDDYVVPMTPRAHQLLSHYWNKEWKKFFENPNVTAADAHMKAAELWRGAGLGNLPVGQFKR